MAKPETTDGYIQLAYELGAALAYSGFSKPAQVIVWYVMAQTFGKKKAMHAKLTSKELSDRTGISRQNINRAFRELTDGGAIVEPKEGRFRVIKDYEKWTRRKEPRNPNSVQVPRLTEAEIADCLNMPDYMWQFHPEEVHPKAKTHSRTKPVESNRTQKRVQLDSVLSPIGLPSDKCDKEERGSSPEKGERRNTPPTPKGVKPGEVTPPAPKIEPAELTRSEVHAILLRATRDRGLADDFAAAAAAKVRDEDYPSGDVIGAWGRVVRSKLARQDWVSAVGTNLRTRREEAQAKSAKLAAGIAPAKEAALPGRWMPDVVDPDQPVYPIRFEGKSSGGKR